MGRILISDKLLKELNMKKIFALVLLAVFLIPQIAWSEEGSGFYASATGGILIPNDMNLPDSQNNNGQTTPYVESHNDYNNLTGRFETGSFGAIAFGKNWGSFFRTELEYGFRRAAFDSVDGTVSAYQIEFPSPGDDEQERLAVSDRNTLVLQRGGIESDIKGSAVGNMSIHSLMANVFLDGSNKTRLTPYFGVGVGLAFWKYDYIVDGLASRDFNSIYGVDDIGEPDTSDDFQPGSNISKKDDGADFAYQLMAGVAFDFTDNIKGTAGYRLFGVANAYDFVAHSTEIGIRYSF